MLDWVESTRRNQAGMAAYVSYTAQIPHWGRASIHPHIHHPGELFLDCPALGIDMHPLGQVLAEDAWCQRHLKMSIFAGMECRF